jgi:hypothetical protein
MPCTEKKYYIATGAIAVAELDSDDNPIGFVDLGESPRFEWDETIEYAENYSTANDGPNVLDMRVVIKRTLNVTVAVKEHAKRVLDLLFQSNGTDSTAGSVADEVTADTLEVGSVHFTANPNVDVDSVVIKDSATGTAATLVPDTDYKVSAGGGIKFLNLGTYTQPFHIAYDYGIVTHQGIMTDDPAPLAIMFDGENLTRSPQHHLRARVDRVILSASKIPLKTGSATGTANTANEYELTGMAELKCGNTAKDGYGAVDTW